VVGTRRFLAEKILQPHQKKKKKKKKKTTAIAVGSWDDPAALARVVVRLMGEGPTKMMASVSQWLGAFVSL
jgi:hypothetical protein